MKQKQLTPDVAESPAIYQLEDQPGLDVHARSFQDAVEQSKYMSIEQKDVWHSILVHEGYT